MLFLGLHSKVKLYIRGETRGTLSDIEEQKRDRNFVWWQTDFGECTGKAEAVQQPKGKGDNPGIGVGQAFMAMCGVHDFNTQEND